MVDGFEKWPDERAEVMMNRRAAFKSSELLDFGRDVMLTFEMDIKGREGGDLKTVLLSRHQAQKLFDEMWWAYYFRPMENP